LIHFLQRGSFWQFWTLEAKKTQGTLGVNNVVTLPKIFEGPSHTKTKYQNMESNTWLMMVILPENDKWIKVQ
jgi:hypothetical protein